MIRISKFSFLTLLGIALSGSLCAQQTRLPYILDMVHNNPGEPLTQSVFNNPVYLQKQGYTGQVINDFVFAHAALTFDSFDKRIFPEGSKERKWVLAAAAHVRANIRRAHRAGLAVYYFTDLIVLPKKLVALYHDQICDAQGRISLERPMTLTIHRVMLHELFKTFPDLDGLVIRTGETYLNNVPYHTGNNPITNGPESHIKLLNLLREEVCVKRHKKVFYRTWSFGGMHDDPVYYQKVVSLVAPHPDLIFSIKHTQGDYQRTFGFNPTLGLGHHRQIVEIECQREYEGKGAYPDYVMNGVIEGFEEYGLNGNTPQTGFRALKDLRGNPDFAGVWSWSRGGGWVGPYIKNEFWCRLNAYVISHWGQNTHLSELQVFDRFLDAEGIRGKSRGRFRELCLLSAKAVLLGHASALKSWKPEWIWWMRDEFLGGIDSGALKQEFADLYPAQRLQQAVDEKYAAVKLWERIVALADSIELPDRKDEHFIRVSSLYGLRLYGIIADGWQVMALGYAGDRTGRYNKPMIATAIRNYDQDWAAYRQLKKENADCPTLYRPYGFVYQGPAYHGTAGIGASVDRYRKLLNL
jgi:hypothetical protein